MKKEPKSIIEWQQVFSDLYSSADSNRTPEQMWIAVMAHTSEIGESIRTFRFPTLLWSAAHTFCWLCSFINKCNSLKNDVFWMSDSLSGIIYLKYPHVCGHCRGSPCSCKPVEIDSEANKSADYKELAKIRRSILKSSESHSIAESKVIFDRIFGARTHIQTLENIGFHFLEEVGEAAICVRALSQLRNVCEDSNAKIDKTFLKQLSTIEDLVENHAAFTMKPKEIDSASRKPQMLKARLVNAKMGLVGEMGDLFSWFCAILNKLDSILKAIYDDPRKHNDILKPLNKVLYDEYFDSDGKPNCPSCKSNPCTCVFYNIDSGD